LQANGFGRTEVFGNTKRLSEIAEEVGGSEETSGRLQEEDTDSLQSNSQPGQCFKARLSVLTQLVVNPV
jgi:hypothetical protein